MHWVLETDDSASLCTQAWFAIAISPTNWARLGNCLLCHARIPTTMMNRNLCYLECEVFLYEERECGMPRGLNYGTFRIIMGLFLSTMENMLFPRNMQYKIYSSNYHVKHISTDIISSRTFHILSFQNSTISIFFSFFHCSFKNFCNRVVQRFKISIPKVNH